MSLIAFIDSTLFGLRQSYRFSFLVVIAVAFVVLISNTNTLTNTDTHTQTPCGRQTHGRGRPRNVPKENAFIENATATGDDGSSRAKNFVGCAASVSSG